MIGNLRTSATPNVYLGLILFAVGVRSQHVSMHVPSSKLGGPCWGWSSVHFHGDSHTHKDSHSYGMDDHTTYVHLYIFIIIEGSLEVKLSTTWTNEKQRWEESEKRREEKRRRKKINKEKVSEKRISRCAKR